MRTTTKLGSEIAPGDSIVFCDTAYRIASIEPYLSPVGEALVAFAEGGEWEMTLFADEEYRVAA